jgi:hypothetical protein
VGLPEATGVVVFVATITSKFVIGDSSSVIIVVSLLQAPRVETYFTSGYACISEGIVIFPSKVGTLDWGMGFMPVTG